MANVTEESVVEVLNSVTATAFPTLAEFSGIKDADIFVAYIALLLMALIPIYIGSHWSLSPKKDGNDKEPPLTTKEAAMFPLYASGFLLGLYAIFKIFGKDYINFILSIYFVLIGAVSIGHVLTRPLRNIIQFLGLGRYLTAYKLSLTRNEEDLFNLTFDYSNIFSLLVGSVVGAVYFKHKQWMANNLFGLSLCICGIESVSLGTYKIGLILLGGLFLYDIFWVFGTDVMVTVATSFDAPVKLLFPKDLAFFESSNSRSFFLLGLGDIVVPGTLYFPLSFSHHEALTLACAGIFIAFLLRFDKRKSEKKAHFSKVYFWTGFLAYIIGLIGTVLVMHFSKASQPALLYLVPSCVGSTFLAAAIRRELPELFAYSDEDEKKKISEKKQE
ncbi:minor histocompatibility antigen H13-like isoform X2 [Zophobas morio]|uniref:minor histocompatibility antigen H13-like isoform X2 n=1 Tax=Zophobas morio TaxID=2755281 RepID=UPI00308309BB